MDIDGNASFKFQALCGSYNDNPEDDFKSANGLIEEAKEFGESWLQETCPPTTDTENDPEECKVSTL